jgi:AraC-like DNA-binding protein
MILPTKKIHVNTIPEYHKLANIPKPSHPLLSVIKFEDLRWEPEDRVTSIVRNFYTVALKKNNNAKFRYGQHGIDFDGSVLHFMLPKQVLTIESSVTKLMNSGWLLLIHPDLLLHTPLAKKIKQYEYFNYKFNQALPLSPEQETIIVQIFKNICQEQRDPIDKYNQNVIMAQIELLLAYSEQFYQRQFVVKKKDEHSLLTELEFLLNEYFKNNELVKKGIPTISYIAGELNISPNYLSRLLQTLTGQSTKHFLHDKLIELGKEKLSTTELSVSEISYELGFKFTQSFSKLFKSKTNQTPLEFRKSFY